MSYVTLSITDLVLAASLVLVNGIVSLLFNLKIERTLAIAAVRMVAQLALAGLVLKLVFEQTSPLWTLLMAAIMVGAAGYEAMARQERRLAGWHAFGLGTGTLLIVGTVAAMFAVAGVIRPEPWYAPRYLLPLLGMVLGNALTGVALTLDTLTSSTVRERTSIEARLALGANRFVAMTDVLRRCLRVGMMPIVNAMAATGVVALPGMMTGQILAGVDPVEAAKYQVMIMFVIAGSTAMAVVATGLGGVLLLTDNRHRLRLDRLKAQTTQA